MAHVSNSGHTDMSLTLDVALTCMIQNEPVLKRPLPFDFSVLLSNYLNM